MKGNEPAFPITQKHLDDYHAGGGSTLGLTVREWFAGMAMQGMLASGFINFRNVDEGKVWAERWADAMCNEGADDET